MESQSKKLCLGSGDWHWSGWVMLDADPNNHPDIIAALPPLPDAVKRVKWDVILMSHFLEHLWPDDALDLVRECREALAPGGHVDIELPDVSYCAKTILGLHETPPEEWPGQYGLYGILGDPRYHNPLMNHRSGFSPATLTALAVEAGFDPSLIRIEEAKYHKPIRDFRLLAYNK